jgi:hypothetical protein
MLRFFKPYVKNIATDTFRAVAGNMIGSGLLAGYHFSANRYHSTSRSASIQKKQFQEQHPFSSSNEDITYLSPFNTTS